VAESPDVPQRDPGPETTVEGPGSTHLGRASGSSWVGRSWRLLRMPLILCVVVLLLGRCGMADRLFYHPIREATPAPTWLHPGAEAFWVDTPDGTRLRAWFVPGTDPDDPDDLPSRRATVVHVHGNAGNMNYHVDFTSHLAAHGFNLVLFDYRGFGESGGSARRRAEMIDDTRQALRAVAARDDVDASRLGVFGQSLGGAIAISALVAELDEPNGVRVRALVLESPFSSWRGIAANAVGGDPPFLPARWLAAALVDDSYSPLDAAPRLTVPTLIVHGDADRIVPPSHGRRLAEVLPDAQLEILVGGDHNTLMRTHSEVGVLVRAFFERALTEP